MSLSGQAAVHGIAQPCVHELAVRHFNLERGLKPRHPTREPEVMKRRSGASSLRLTSFTYGDGARTIELQLARAVRRLVNRVPDLKLKGSKVMADKRLFRALGCRVRNTGKLRFYDGIEGIFGLHQQTRHRQTRVLLMEGVCPTACDRDEK